MPTAATVRCTPPLQPRSQCRPVRLPEILENLLEQPVCLFPRATPTDDALRAIFPHPEPAMNVEQAVPLSIWLGAHRPPIRLAASIPTASKSTGSLDVPWRVHLRPPAINGDASSGGIASLCRSSNDRTNSPIRRSVPPAINTLH